MTEERLKKIEEYIKHITNYPSNMLRECTVEIRRLKKAVYHQKRRHDDCKGF